MKLCLAEKKLSKIIRDYILYRVIPYQFNKGSPGDPQTLLKLCKSVPINETESPENFRFITEVVPEILVLKVRPILQTSQKKD